MLLACYLALVCLQIAIRALFREIYIKKKLTNQPTKQTNKQTETCTHGAKWVDHVLLSPSTDLVVGVVCSRVIYVNIKLNGLCNSSIPT